MKEIIGNVWDFVDKVDVICITTNGFLKKNQDAVLGAGVAKGLRDRFPMAETVLGRRMKDCGAYNIHEICKMGKTKIWSFPVKPIYVIANDLKSNLIERVREKYRVGETVPGFHSMASLELITQSANKIYEQYNKLNLSGVVMLPKPGCYNGGLQWSDVKKALLSTNIINLKDNLCIIDLKSGQDRDYDKEPKHKSDWT